MFPAFLFLKKTRDSGERRFVAAFMPAILCSALVESDREGRFHEKKVYAPQESIFAENMRVAISSCSVFEQFDQCSPARLFGVRVSALREDRHGFGFDL